MKNITLLLLTWFGTLTIAVAQLQARTQQQHSCADSRIQTATRQAVATPEHMKLMNMYDVAFYGLDLALERNSVNITGSVTTQAQVKNSPLQVFAFELHPNFTIEGVTINGVNQTNITRNNSDVSVNLTTPVAANSTLKAVIKYSGNAPNSGNAAIGNGFSAGREANWGGADVAWSLSEPYAAYEWWPTKQVLTDKADSVHVFVTTSAENKAGSNGLLTKTVPLPNNKVRYEWKSHYPIAYYLISVAVSNYIEYNLQAKPAGAPAPVPIVNYIYNTNTLNIFKAQIDLTAPLLETFSELFTLFPFAAEKYGHSMAPIGGGMEHQTMTTQSSFNFTLTAHELAHQWFGDNVTCASWQDIWLNEGFASYAEYLALERLQPFSAPDWIRTAQGRVLAIPNGSIFVPDTTNVSRIFNYRLSYAKGATVIHMLRFTVNNDEQFFRALRTYQTQYRGKTATTADLQRVFEEVTGLSLGYFFDQWYKAEGWPTISINWEQQGEQLVLNATQTPSTGTQFFKTDVEYLIQTTTGEKRIRVAQGQPTEQYQVPITGEVTGVIIDPDNWLLAKKVVENVTASPEIPEELTARIYPNPTTDLLALDNLGFQPLTVEVHDRTGKRVLRQQLQRQQQPQISVATLPAGLYFINVSNGSKNFRSRFVKL